MLVFSNMIVILASYILVNAYMLLRASSMLRGAGAVRGIVCGSLFLLSLAFPVGRIFYDRLPTYLASLLVYVGSWYLAPMTYTFMLSIAADVLRLLNRALDLVPIAPFSVRGRATVAAAIVLTAAGICALGAWNASAIVSVHHEVTHRSLEREPLKIAMFSDTHVGRMTGSSRLAKAVELTASESPDIVLMAGDILDDTVLLRDPASRRGLLDLIGSLSPRLGIWAVLGNHEYYAGADECEAFLIGSGVHVLHDEVATPGGELTLIGRDDPACVMNGAARADISSIAAGANLSAEPIIVLDHQPRDLDGPESIGALLQVSGHTHRGQLVPFNFAVDAIFECAYGLYKKGSTNYYISCGAGTWGPPVRTSGRPEVAFITVRYQR